MDASEGVDLVDEAVPLARRCRIGGVVVGAPDVDAPGGADARAQLTTDALLHPVLVPVQHVAAVHAHRLVALEVGRTALAGPVLTGDDAAGVGSVTEELLEGDGEATEEAHVGVTSSCATRRPCA